MRAGFSRLELLIALVFGLGALGFLAMLLARHRENAQAETCKNNLRILGQAFHAYHTTSAADTKKQFLPPSRLASGYATWGVLLAPHFLKDHPLLAWDLERPYAAQAKLVREARVFPYFCPQRRRPESLSHAGDVDSDARLLPGGLGDYGVIAGDGSVEPDWSGVDGNGAIVPAINLTKDGDRIVQWESQTRFDSLVRGLSQTLLVGERHIVPEDFGDAHRGDGSVYNGEHHMSFARLAGPGFPLTKSLDEPNPRIFSSWHARGVNFLLADGSVQTFTNSMSEAILGNLARRGE